MKIGLDVFLEKDYKQFVGKRVGLITNMTGVNKNLLPAIDLFNEHPNIQLTALYAPEHGIRGDAKEGEKFETTTDPYTGLPVYSLYGATRKPDKAMLDKVDVLIFDLQDIGARYYTYIYTMAYVMEACKEEGKHFIVLDRPNPVTGSKMEGNLVEEDVRSFVGLLPIPNRHGMTVAEIATMFKYEFGYDCDLTVIPMEGWERDNYYDETGLFWVPPSPNTTNIEMNILYPGTCLFEGTNLSEGRGTTKPFEQIGAPYIDGQQLAKVFNQKQVPGVLARPTSFIPTYQKYTNEICGGVQLHVSNRNELNSFEAGVILLETIAEMYESNFNYLQNEHGKYFFDLLAGTKGLRNIISKGASQTFFEACNKQIVSFQKQRENYLLYK